jgi:hypothetical protein
MTSPLRHFATCWIVKKEGNFSSEKGTTDREVNGLNPLFSQSIVESVVVTR